MRLELLAKIKMAADLGGPSRSFAAYLPRTAANGREKSGRAGYSEVAGSWLKSTACHKGEGPDLVISWSRPSFFILLGVGREGLEPTTKGL
jgi:hypothetical protein